MPAVIPGFDHNTAQAEVAARTPRLAHVEPGGGLGGGRTNDILPPMIADGIDLIWRGDGYLVVNKPAGLLTQAPPGIDSLERRIKQFLQPEVDPRAVYLGVPHRLDRPVSGVMVFAEDRKTARKLSKQFERRRVRKVYWAGVSGRLSPEQGEWRDTIRKIPGLAQAELVPPHHPEGASAVLRYRVLGAGGERSLLEIELETGRMHQIRLQAAARGHPVLGDVQYGSSVVLAEGDEPWLRPIALHAHLLEIFSPATQTVIAYTARPPQFWDKLNLPLDAAGE